MYSRIEDLLTTEVADSTQSKQIAYWLTSNGSLTALLEQQAGQRLKVERAFEGYRPLTLAQKKQLGYQGTCLTRPMMAWVREVLLYGNSKQPWVVARSLFPLPSLQGEAKRLQSLQNTPIGYVLFKRQNKLPSIRYFQSIKSQSQQAPITEKTTTTATVDVKWCRHTLYDWYRRPLLISETFLPDFFA
ncbi:chorismate--pyruvate lyase family protein [Psychrobacter lutiphocae]|uniref:chorismate--pyruvate lyase family protein n=1 Tax=Psychrobacter lutiphocae TaxID=540500 RepID=UPI00068498EB